MLNCCVCLREIEINTVKDLRNHLNLSLTRFHVVKMIVLNRIPTFGVLYDIFARSILLTSTLLRQMTLARQLTDKTMANLKPSHRQIMKGILASILMP
jgi:hypothetical protein